MFYTLFEMLFSGTNWSLIGMLHPGANYTLIGMLFPGTNYTLIGMLHPGAKWPYTAGFRMPLRFLKLEQYLFFYVVNGLNLKAYVAVLNCLGINESSGLEECLTVYNKDVDMPNLKADVLLWTA